MVWAGSGFRKLVTFEFRFNRMMRYRQRGERAYSGEEKIGVEA